MEWLLPLGMLRVAELSILRVVADSMMRMIVRLMVRRQEIAHFAKLAMAVVVLHVEQAVRLMLMLMSMVLMLYSVESTPPSPVCALISPSTPIDHQLARLRDRELDSAKVEQNHHHSC